MGVPAKFHSTFDANTLCLAAILIASQPGTVLSQARPSNARPTHSESKQQEAHRLVAQGQLAIRQRRYRQAEDLLRQARDADPSGREATQELGRLYEAEERVEDAIAIYELQQRKAPISRGAKADLAALYQKAGDHKKSLATLLSIPATALPERSLPVLAADYLATGQPDHAQDVIAKILQRAGANPDLVPRLATLFLDQGFAGDAASLLQVAEKHQEQTASFVLAKARVLSSMGKAEPARTALTRALALDPENPDARLEQARQEGNAGNWQGSVTLLQKMVKDSVPRASVLQSLVYAAMRADDLQAAHDAAVDLYQLTPSRAQSALSLAVVLVRASHWGEAEPLLAKALAADSGDKRALLAMGVVQYNLGDFERARQSLLQSLGQGSPDAEAYYTLGLLAKQAGKPEEAIRNMEQSRQADPDKPETLASLGQLYLQLDQAAQAQDVLEKAIAKAPGSPQNHYQLGLAYRKLGLADKARQQMEIFQKLSARKIDQPTGESLTLRP